MARASNGFLANRAAGYLTEEEKRRLDAEVVGSPITLYTGKVVTFTQGEIDEFRKSGKMLGAFLREKGLTKEEAQELKEKTDVAYVVSDRTETQSGKTYRKRNIASYNQLTGKEVGTTGVRLELSDVDFDDSGLDNIDRNDVKRVVATQIRTASDGSIHATARITTSDGSYEAELTLNSLPKSMQQSATSAPQFARAEDANERFNRELDELTEENADSMRFNLGIPSEILQSAGIEAKPMILYGNKIVKKAKKHGFSIQDLKGLPNAIQNPIAVFAGADTGSHAILTELTINGRNVLATLSVGKNNDIDFNIVRSVFTERTLKV